MKKRDSQMSRVYNAERSLPEFGRKDLGANPSVQDAQDFIDTVTQTAWFKKHYPARALLLWKNQFGETKREGGIEVRHSQGAGGARAYGRIIEASGYMRNRLILLHELAHNVSPHGSGHDRKYCENYLALVQHVMGVAVAKQLKAAFRLQRVKYSPKRVLSPETLAALRVRGHKLIAARKAGSMAE